MRRVRDRGSAQKTGSETERGVVDTDTRTDLHGEIAVIRTQDSG